jgi:hypothetical protein
MGFWIPSFNGELVVFVNEQPLLTRTGKSTPDERKSPGELVTVKIEMQIAVGEPIEN